MKQRRCKDTVNMKTYNQQILQYRQDESNASFIKGKDILHQTTSYELVAREDKCEVKTTRSSNQRQYKMELPDEGMTWTHQQNVDARSKRNNEKAKVINID
ncbi:Hypothetical predicted protein, partial [Paramuricea clavata]